MVLYGWAAPRRVKDTGKIEIQIFEASLLVGCGIPCKFLSLYVILRCREREIPEVVKWLRRRDDARGVEDELVNSGVHLAYFF
jgi:hypothetical protein